MLLRNLNQNMGLCNGTRLLVLELGQRLLKCMVLTGANIGEEVFIPRTALNTTDVKWPFTLQRRQFPVRICYAMTINKTKDRPYQRSAFTSKNMSLPMANFMLLFQGVHLEVALKS